MEKIKIFQLVFTIILGLICIFGILNLFNHPANLKDSQKLIENVIKEVRESKEIIKNQQKNIEDLKELNKELAVKIKQVDSTNTLIKSNLDNNFIKTNRTINDIKKTVDDIKPVEIH
jgi:hypothetical protein